MNLDKESVRKRALELAASDHRGIGARLASEFGVSRQVANGYLQAMVRDGLIDAEGTTRSKVYRLRTLASEQKTYACDGLQEDVVWREGFSSLLADLPKNVRHIWNYGATEMINNAIDHSGSPEVRVSLVKNALHTDVHVADHGEGIFRKIQRALGLHDPRAAILELAKGKLTTAPEKHSGEGIFFTSRVMDAFEILSGSLRFRHDERLLDTLTDRPSDAPGTVVIMRLTNHSERTMQSVFDRFADPEDYTFEKTEVPIRLAQYEGEKLVSRSQAKRVVHRFERFKYVELDFSEIDEIGQAFADELFRVFAAAHPNIRLKPINTSTPVAQMIRRAVRARSDAS